MRAGVWGDLQLTVNTGAEQKIDGLVDSYSMKKEQEYETYWMYRNQQSDDYVAGLSDGNTYYVVNDFLPFDSEDVDNDDNTILVETNHGLSDGDQVIYYKGNDPGAAAIVEFVDQHLRGTGRRRGA